MHKIFSSNLQHKSLRNNLLHTVFMIEILPTKIMNTIHHFNLLGPIYSAFVLK